MNNIKEDKLCMKFSPTLSFKINVNNHYDGKHNFSYYPSPSRLPLRIHPLMFLHLRSFRTSTISRNFAEFSQAVNFTMVGKVFGFALRLLENAFTSQKIDGWKLKHSSMVLSSLQTCFWNPPPAESGEEETMVADLWNSYFAQKPWENLLKSSFLLKLHASALQFY